MTNFNINYNLTKCEMLLFPLVPAYALRHLKKEGWENKVLGLIELFPGLGPLVACTEGIVHSIFEKNVEKSESTGINEKKAEEKAWFEAFKEKALAHFNTVQKSGKIDEQKPNFELTPEQLEALTTVVNLVKNRNDREIKKIATCHSLNGDYVISLKEIPGLIFKLNPLSSITIEERYEATQKAKKIVEQENLTFLHVPAQKILQIKTEGGKVLKVLAEERYEILESCFQQENLFKYCIHDPDLKPVGQEYVRQLIILILKTGYADVRYNNNPILSNGQGIGLVDMDFGNCPLIGLKKGCSKTEETGLLCCLTPELIENFESLIKENLTAKQFQDLNLESIKEAIKSEEEKIPGFLKFLEKHQVKTCKETVNWQSRFTFFTKKDEQIEHLEKRINRMASDNLGINPQSERKFFLNDANFKKRDALLDKLKAQNKIYDWRVPASEYGYYIYC